MDAGGVNSARYAEDASLASSAAPVSGRERVSEEKHKELSVKSGKPTAVPAIMASKLRRQTTGNVTYGSMTQRTQTQARVRAVRSQFTVTLVLPVSLVNR